MSFGGKFWASLSLSILIIPSAFAQDLQTAVNRVTQAYAIEKLERAKTIRVESDRRFTFPSHDYSTDFPDFSRQRFHDVIDMAHESGSHEYLTEISGTRYHGRVFLTDGKSTHIFYGPDTYQDEGEADFYVRFGGTFRGSDVLMALWMTRPEANARHTGEAMWLGFAHDLVQVDFPNSPPLNLFVRRKDGAITKMERTLPDGRNLFYTFENHEKSDGILVAREHSFYLEDERSYFSFNRDVKINDRKDKRAFELDKTIAPEPTRVDQSNMRLRSYAPDNNQDPSLFHVCQGEQCTTFMTVDDSLIGFGLGEGLNDRLDAFRKETGIAQSLTHIIAADHHDEDIGGAKDAIDAGATLWVTEDTAKKLGEISDPQSLEIVTDVKHIGNVMIIPLATDHAATVLVAYHTSHKTLIQTGHYFSPFPDRPAYARYTALSLYEALPDTIQSDATSILSGQDIKRETWSDFVSAIESFTHISCHRNRPICRE